ncbi:MAG: GDSL-type esterase/lipase family protein [Candidatus Omnitrophota bacterium]|jgi:lysophospholipase L1-like esterase
MDSEGTNIICFGNSITYGSGVERGQDYPSLLGDLLGEEVINAGVGGDTTRDALKRLDEDVLDNDPYLVIVELGANDYFKGVPKEEAVKNMETIITRIQEEGAMTAICDVSAGSAFGIHDVYHDELKKMARRTGSIFIPYLMKGILQKPSLKMDNLHPNAEGYRIFSKRVYRAIKPYVK